MSRKLLSLAKLLIIFFFTELVACTSLATLQGAIHTKTHVINLHFKHGEHPYSASIQVHTIEPLMSDTHGTRLG